MNLQTISPQTIPFPFARASFEDLNREERYRQMSIPSQQRVVIIPRSVGHRLKENLSLSPEALSILGENGRRRFDEFKRYPIGWYGGKGNKISKHSVDVLEIFIKKIPELRHYGPSLFLTLEGNISIGFEDKTQQNIEIEFFPDKVEYFVESLQEESSIGLVDIFELAGKIRKLLK